MFIHLIAVANTEADYASAVIGSLGLIGIINWFGYATKHYSGPRLDNEHVNSGDRGM